MATAIATTAPKTIIPTKSKTLEEKIITKISESLDSVEKLLTVNQRKQIKKDLEIKKIDAKTKEREKALQKLYILEQLSYKQYKIAKGRNKIDAYLEKFMVKNNFVKKLLDGMQGIGGFLKKQGAKGLLSGFLKLLLMGGLIKILVPYFMNLLKMIVNMIVTYGPVVVKAVWNLFWDVVVPGFASIGKTIGDSIFGKGSVFGQILGTIGGFVPILFVVNKALGFFGGSLSTVFKVAIKVFPFLFKGLMTVITGIGIIPIIIATVITLAIAFSNKILNFINFIGNWLEKKLGFIGKFINNIVLQPFKLLFGILFGIKTFILDFKKFGLKKALLLFKINLKILFIKTFKEYTIFISLFWKKIKDAFKWIVDKVSNALAPVAKLFKGIFGPIIKTMTEVYDIIGDRVLKGFAVIKEAFEGIGDWFAGLTTFGPWDWLNLGKEKKESYYDLRKTAREKNIDLDVVEKYAKGEAVNNAEMYKTEKLVAERLQTQTGGKKKIEDMINTGKISTEKAFKGIKDFDMNKQNGTTKIN